MAKSKEELIYDIENELVDPTTNKITGERVKARLLDMVDAMGEGGGGGASQMEYWAVSPEVGQSLGELFYFMTQVKASADGVTLIMSPVLGTNIPLVAFSIDRSMKVLGGDGSGLTTIGDMLVAMGIDLNELGATQIDEAQFYA